jgi:hypothetical protein
MNASGSALLICHKGLGSQIEKKIIRKKRRGKYPRL